ncbi:sigma-54 interaction domain-containing protein [Pseudodesulfovibrio senegalensis]|uniref:PAS domain-containing protein n=1 Tax=Pseudodesulfovibrio senegalensis TaxID=1721087 RepID=A0A6N6N275_9BACT|nr:sigma 54-interacting transcriptional regulator [Pseudodesulfovibrio senegalensis]KAB1441515.1 PAS domain-containing protein [Pseudodesulfovibrio senegalensis]
MNGQVDSTGLKRILDCVGLGVFAVDTDWRIIFFSREAERITGFTAQEAMGRLCRDVFGSDRCVKKCHLQQAMRSGRNVVKARVEIVNRNNRRVPLEVTAAVLRDEQGTVLGGVESFVDLTARQALEKCVRQSYRFSDMVGRDPAMQRLFRTVEVVAPTEATVLLQGDTGTGKDLLARVIHNLSPRSSGPYVKVNCAAIPASLLESQLFGYRKGAFTDAREDRPGLFAEAQGGSIFLDEVGDIPLESQAKLLQVLDEQQYIPLGATSPESVDVRLMAATNRDLAAMADRGVFRPDLFYRLRVVELALPPLSERRCDIPLLIDHFLNEFSALQGKTAQELSPRALKVLLDYHYPGNVRELRHIIEHGVILSTGETIHAADLPHYLLSGPRPAVPGGDASDETDERTRLRQHLDRHGWRMNEAAQALGIDRTTLWRRRRKHGL